MGLVYVLILLILECCKKGICIGWINYFPVCCRRNTEVVTDNCFDCYKLLQCFFEPVCLISSVTGFLSQKNT